ncbi:MAG: c-type cytochrome [Chloroflexi bacterium]|nr:c-type cytochrome [Chloroflexota bacterium]
MSRNRIALALIATVLTMVAAFTLAGPRTTRAAPSLAAEGKTIYAQRCEICHGENGDGKGPAAEIMFPKPRDFTFGEFKIRTTSSDSPPTDGDLIGVIGNGMPGSTMPAWKNVLSKDEIAAVAAYVKTFSDAFGGEAPQPIKAGNRVKPDGASVARGAQVFRDVQCFKCHGDAGRGDGPSALKLKDDYDNAIFPADLTQAWLFRGGGTANDIYMRIMTGMTGSPMPSFADALVDENGNPDEQKRWDLVNYVDSLSPDTAPEPQAAIILKPIDGDIPTEPAAVQWQSATLYYYPLVGEIMREPRDYTPSIKGVWVRGLYNSTDLGLLVQWDDRQQNTGAEGQPQDEIDVQFQTKVPEGAERPYFVYGDADHPVNLWTWTAGASVGVEQTGKGSDSVAPQAAQNLTTKSYYTAGRYSVVFRRSLNTGDAEDIALSSGVFVPIAFAASDGLRGETPGHGAISSWYQIYLGKPVPATNYVWIPVAVVVAAALEALLLWAVRRNAKRDA